MQQRLHWALTITALVVALLGVTSLGSAAVNTGVAAAKAPLYASGLLTRGPRGPRGRRGLRGLRGPAGHAGPHGDAGDPGVRGPRGSAFVARARSVGTVSAPGNEPLTGNTWMQAAAEDDVVYGAITYQSPPLCTTSGAPPQLSVNVYVDGAPAGVLVASDLVTPGATATFSTPLFLFAPGTDTTRTLTATLSTTCLEQFTITDVRLDVAAFA